MRFQRCRFVQNRAARSVLRNPSLLVRLSVGGVMMVVALAALARERAGDAVAVAIKDAHIVIVNGKTVAKGTVVWRGGIIEAVGENVPIPADARVIDGTGLTVYPGLIDATTSLGLPSAPPAVGAGRGPGAPPQPPGEQVPSGLDPGVEIADSVKPGGTAIEQERSLGVTTALTANTRGMFLGKSALINLAGEETPAMIVKAPVGLHVQFQGSRGGTYPGSLMGVMAYFRQAMLDAQNYQAEWEHYARRQRGTRRPAPDKALEALLPVIAGEMPVIFHVNTVNDIKRAVGLAEEFKLKYIISGGLDGWKIAGWLKQKNVPLLVSLNYPKANPNADPDEDVPLRVLRDRADAPKNPGALAKAGLKFAFTSGGMQNITDLMPNVRKAIENGLSEDAAIRALTIDAAEIFGVGEQLGSIETGKIANLVVTTGNLFDKDTQVKNVFIDGAEIEVKKPEEKLGGGGPAAAVNASGKWELTVLSPSGQIQVTANLAQSGDRITGSTTSQFGTSQISSGSITGKRVTFTISFDAGGQQITATFSGTIDGDSISGTVAVGGQGSFEFSGRRTP